MVLEKHTAAILNDTAAHYTLGQCGFFFSYSMLEIYRKLM